MTVFRYDKSWEGLLTAVFDAYARRQFPERLLADGEPLPLFCDETLFKSEGLAFEGSEDGELDDGDRDRDRE